MPLTQTTIRVAPFVVLIAALVFPIPGRSAAPIAQAAGSKAIPPAEVEVRCVDDSVIKLKILDTQLELTTRYGSLQVPVADIRRIDFATRTPPAIAQQISHLISNLNHPDFDVREKMMRELRGLRERAYFPLLKAIKNEDPEISRRAEETVQFLQQKYPPGQLENREWDVIQTEDSKICGRLVATTLRVLTFQFGEQSLRLADVRTLRSAAGVFADDLANAPPAPANLTVYQNQFGKELAFTVTGPQPGSQGTGLWGTDVYSLDSNLGAAAVHAGLVTPGQTGPVRIRIVASPIQYVGSLRNGINSSAYGAYPAGGFEFIRK